MKPRALSLDTTTFPSRCTQTLRSLSDTQWHLHFTTFGAIKKTHSSLFKEISWESCRWVVFSQGEGDDSQRGEGVCSSGSLCLFLSRKQIFILPVVRTSHSSSPSSLSLGKFVSGHIFAFSYIFSLIVDIRFFLRSQPGVHFRLKKRTGHSESELIHHRVAQTSSSDTAESESVTDDPDVKVQFGERRVYLLSMLMMLSVGRGGGSYMWGYPWRFICPGIFLQFGVTVSTHTHTHALCRQTKYVQIEQAISGSAVCSSSENMQDISQTRQWLFFLLPPSLSFFYIKPVSYGPELVTSAQAAAPLLTWFTETICCWSRNFKRLAHYFTV